MVRTAAAAVASGDFSSLTVNPRGTPSVINISNNTNSNNTNNNNTTTSTTNYYTNNNNITNNTPSTHKKLDTINEKFEEVASDVKVMKDIIARSSAAKQATQPSTPNNAGSAARTIDS